MSLDKAIKSGKEHRRPYTKPKRLMQLAAIMAVVRIVLRIVSISSETSTRQKRNGVMLCRVRQTISFGYTPCLSSIAPETGLG